MWFWELNSRPLQEQQPLLSTKHLSSPQTPLNLHCTLEPHRELQQMTLNQ